MKALFPAYIKIIKIEPRCFNATFVQQFFPCSRRIAQRLYFTLSFFDAYYKMLKITEVFWIKLFDGCPCQREVPLFSLSAIGVGTAETQQQAHSRLDPLFLHAQSQPPCTPTNEEKAVGMGVLKRDVYCHWRQLTYLRLLCGADTGFRVSLQHWGAGETWNVQTDKPPSTKLPG